MDVENLSPYVTHTLTQHKSRDIHPLDVLRERERRDVLDALERNHWVQSWAARQLGITLRQMGYRVRKFGLEKLVKQRGTW